MDEKVVKEILDDLFSSLEALDTRSQAVLEFLKGKGLAVEKEFAPYLEEASNASSVRWLATRVRIEYLLSGAEKKAKDEQPEVEKAAEPKQENDKEPAAETGPTAQGEGSPAEAGAGSDPGRSETKHAA